MTGNKPRWQPCVVPRCVECIPSLLDGQVAGLSLLYTAGKHDACLTQGVDPWIEIDGGVGPANAYQVIEAGCNAIVAGSAVFGAKDYAEGMPQALNSLPESWC